MALRSLPHPQQLHAARAARTAARSASCAPLRARQQRPHRAGPSLRKLVTAASSDGKDEPPWARANATEPPPWERKERERALATEEPSELPFGAYLLASVLVAIAAVSRLLCRAQPGWG